MIDHYAVNKFLYDTDRNPDLVRRYTDDPDSYVEWYLAERVGRLLDNGTETSGVAVVDERTRTALKEYDVAFLYAEGAHPFLLWTLMLPVIEAKLASGDFVPPAPADDARPENPGPMGWYRHQILAHGRPDFRY